MDGDPFAPFPFGFRPVDYDLLVSERQEIKLDGIKIK